MGVLGWILLLLVAVYLFYGCSFATALLLICISDAAKSPELLSRETAHQYGLAIVMSVLIWPLMQRGDKESLIDRFTTMAKSAIGRGSNKT